MPRDIIIIDDPHGEATPEDREKALRWWREDIAQRLGDGRAVVILSKVAEREGVEPPDGEPSTV